MMGVRLENEKRIRQWLREHDPELYIKGSTLREACEMILRSIDIRISPRGLRTLLALEPFVMWRGRGARLYTLRGGWAVSLTPDGWIELGEVLRKYVARRGPLFGSIARESLMARRYVERNGSRKARSAHVIAIVESLKTIVPECRRKTLTDRSSS